MMTFDTKILARPKVVGLILCAVSAAFVVATLANRTLRSEVSSRRLSSYVANGSPSSPRRSKLAVLHVGPHKSGSSSIQSLMHGMEKELETDGFSMPTNIPGNFGTYKSMANVAFSLQGAEGEWATTDETWPYFMDFLQNQTNAGRNVLLSSEEFDRPVVNVEGIATALHENFEHVRVVATYRRAYTWLASLYYQNHLPRKYRNKNWGPWLSFVDWLKDYNKITPAWREGGQVSTVVNRYKKYFDDVVLVDFQNQVEPFTVEFFCDAVPGATQTCKTARSGSTQKGLDPNKGSSIEYVRLVYDARFQGLIHKDVTYREAEKSVKHYHEVVNGKSMFDLPHYCLQPDLQEVLFRMTLNEERELMPHLFKHNSGNAQSKLREDFNAFVRAGRLCSIDVPKILQQQEWIDFLGGLKPVVTTTSSQ